MNKPEEIEVVWSWSKNLTPQSDSIAWVLNMPVNQQGWVANKSSFIDDLCVGLNEEQAKRYKELLEIEYKNLSLEQKEEYHILFAITEGLSEKEAKRYAYLYLKPIKDRLPSQNEEICRFNYMRCINWKDKYILHLMAYGGLKKQQAERYFELLGMLPEIREEQGKEREELQALYNSLSSMRSDRLRSNRILI